MLHRLLYPISLKLPRALLVCLMALQATGPGTALGDNIRLPDIGSPVDTILTPSEERRLGRTFMRSVRKRLEIVEDPLLSEYIQSLGDRLAAKSNTRGEEFTFFLVDSPVVNAFAGPAGYIGIYSGLILATEDENELASVLAHEIAHVTQDHLMRAFDSASRMSAPAAMMILAAIILGAAVDDDLGKAAMAGTQAGVVQHQLNFTRKNEEEADRVGIRILADADFDPRSMPVFFERLAKTNRLYESSAPEFLRTHPVTTNRIADALGRAQAYPYKQHPESLDFHLVRATLRSRSFKDPGQAVTFFRDTLAQRRFNNETAQRFGYVLALMRKQDLAEARRQLDDLLKQRPDQLFFLEANARLHHASGQNQKALDSLEMALQLYPSQLSTTLLLAELLIEGRQLDRAESIVRETLELRPDVPSLHRVLSRVLGETGRLGEAHQSLAEYYYLNGELEAATQQLEIALRAKDNNFYRTSRLEARLQEVKTEMENTEKNR